MGNDNNRRKKQKIKGTGEDFIIEEYKINDEINAKKRRSFVRYDSNLLVTQVKNDPLMDYKIIKNLGEGAFGKVYLVEHKITGMVRAMKVIKKSSMIMNKQMKIR